MLRKVNVIDCESCAPTTTMVEESRLGLLREGVAKLMHNNGHQEVVDSPETMAFVVSQLAYTEATVYEREYTEMQFRSLVPVTSEAGPEAASVRYQVYDKVGQGKRVSASSKDVPTADVSAGQVEIQVVNGGAGYRYNQQELIESAKFLRPLPIARMQTAVEMAERHLNEVAMNGEVAGVAGGASYLGMTNQTTGTGAGQITLINQSTSGYIGGWAAQAALGNFQKILADFNLCLLTAWQNSQYVVLPNTVAMDPATYSVLATTYTSLGTKTLLSLIEEGNILTTTKTEQISIEPVYQFANKGFSHSNGSVAASRMLFYRNESRRMIMHIPMPLRFLAPQPEGLDIFVPGTYRYAGLNVRYPYTWLYCDEA